MVITYLSEQPLFGRHKLLMRFLRLRPPREAEYLVSNLQSLDIWSNFHNGPCRTVAKYLRMLDQKTPVILVQIQRR